MLNNYALISYNSVPSSAQQNGACLEEILPCLANAGAQGYPPAAVKPCCPALTNAVTKDKSCFCLMEPGFTSQGAESEAIFNGVLSTCGISGTMSSICFVISVPSSVPPEEPCLKEILPCLANAGAQNYPPAAVKLCCPAITNAVAKDKSCFCSLQPGFATQGADAESIFNGVLGTCGISSTMNSICS
ncbi:Replication factor C subunit 3, partial [Bienertia sinuspersici]